MADMSKSFSFELRVYEVDTVTWADKDMVGGFTSASISRTTGRMLESGTMRADLPLGSQFGAGYYRLVLRVTQGGETERHDLATLYCTSVSGNVDHRTNDTSVEGVSVLYPARHKVMDIGSFVPRGADGASYVERLLSDSIHAPVEARGSFSLSNDFVFDVGATVLDSVWDVLESANWCMQINGRGKVSIMPRPEKPTFEISDGVIMSGVSYEQAVSDVPNRYVAFDGTTLGQCVNDDPQSAVSTVSRGFVRDYDGGIDTSPTLVDGETVGEYCRRRLRELSVVAQKMTGTCEYHDGVLPYSMVTARMQPSNEMCDVMVSSQEVTCDRDVSIDETYVREVRLWQ